MVASGPPWLVSSFRFRARLGFSIPSSFSGPRGITPAFGYGAPHPSARGTSTLLNNALLSAHSLRLPRAGHHPIDDVEGATFTTPGYPAITQITFLACCAHYPGGSNRCACRFLPCPCGLPRLTGGSASTTSLSRPAQASLALRPARLLARLKADVCPEAPTQPVTRPSRSVATMSHRHLHGWILPHWRSAPLRRTVNYKGLFLWVPKRGLAPGRVKGGKGA